MLSLIYEWDMIGAVHVSYHVSNQGRHQTLINIDQICWKLANFNRDWQSSFP